MTVIPHHRGKEIDPYWQKDRVPNQFVDPATGDNIAFWDDSAKPPQAHFYNLGYLKKNPRNEFDIDWDWNPNFDPFKEVEKEEGNNLKFKCRNINVCI